MAGTRAFLPAGAVRKKPKSGPNRGNTSFFRSRPELSRSIWFNRPREDLRFLGGKKSARKSAKAEVSMQPATARRASGGKRFHSSDAFEASLKNRCAAGG